MTQLLEEQQRLAKEILSSTGQINERPEYIELEEDLAQLKMAVPGAETASGYSRQLYPLLFTKLQLCFFRRQLCVREIWQQL